VDFDGSSPAVPFGINVPLVYTAAYACFAIGCIVAPRIPNNAGSLCALKVTAPAGSILNARFPSPVANRHVLGQLLPDVVFGCLRKALPDRIPAEGTSLVWCVMLRGLAARRTGIDDGFLITANTNGGTGARPSKDGLSATAYPSGIRATPVEITEATAPIVYRRKELRIDSGGPGRHRGGHGQAVEIESLDGHPFELLAAFERIDFPPRGHDGGRNGASGAVALGCGRVLRGKGVQDIPGDDVLHVLTPGGGGIGDPFEREVEAVLADVRSGLVSPDAAARDYGVVVDDALEIDPAGTAARRARTGR
jgi:N-methylhydantoinase B